MIPGAIISICIAALIFVITFVASHNPASPKWARNSMIQMVWLPLIIFLLSIAIPFLALGFGSGSDSLTMTDFILSLGAMLLTIAVIRLIEPRKKIENYSVKKESHGKS